MGSIQPTPAVIEKLFLKPSLTPLIQSEAPNYTSIKLLQDELISNAVSVYSPLGDGDTGHLFLVVREAEYVLATTSITVHLQLLHHLSSLFLLLERVLPHNRHHPRLPSTMPHMPLL